MTPDAIIKKHLSKIEGIRLNLVSLITTKILEELKEEGYVIVEEWQIKKPTV